jgi:hypothetical protein
VESCQPLAAAQSAQAAQDRAGRKIPAGFWLMFMVAVADYLHSSEMTVAVFLESLAAVTSSACKAHPVVETC